MLIKRELLRRVKGWDSTLPSNQEYDLQIRLSQITKFDYVPEVLAEVYQSSNQISFNFDKKLNGTKALWKKYRNTFKKEGVYFYNFLRFTYLYQKYRIGKYLGKSFYSILP